LRAAAVVGRILAVNVRDPFGVLFDVVERPAEALA
jgi:hypothetical protein